MWKINLSALTHCLGVPVLRQTMPSWIERPIHHLQGGQFVGVWFILTWRSVVPGLQHMLIFFPVTLNYMFLSPVFPFDVHMMDLHQSVITQNDNGNSSRRLFLI